MTIQRSFLQIDFQLDLTYPRSVLPPLFPFKPSSRLLYRCSVILNLLSQLRFPYKTFSLQIDIHYPYRPPRFRPTDFYTATR